MKKILIVFHPPSEPRLMRLLSLGLVLFASALSILPAQPPGKTEQVPEDATASSPAKASNILLSANSLDGATVVDEAGEEIGTASRIAISGDASLVHLITKVGGVLNVGGKEVAIPMAALSLRPRGKEDPDAAWLTVGQSSENIKGASPLEARDYLELRDADWLQKNAKYFHVDSVAPANELTQWFVSDLINAKVIGKDNETIAYLDDIIFEFGSTPVKYAILGYGGALGIGKEYVAIPFKDLQITADADNPKKLHVQVNLDADGLPQLQKVTPTGYPELKLSSVRRRIDT